LNSGDKDKENVESTQNKTSNNAYPTESRRQKKNTKKTKETKIPKETKKTKKNTKKNANR
jgi:hypothetical protein